MAGARSVVGRPVMRWHSEVLPLPGIPVAWEGQLAGSHYDIIRM